MTAHNFVDSPYEPNCAVCGQKYHCAQCNEGCAMMGHMSKDDRGHFFTCQEPERYEVKKALDAYAYKLRRRAEYEKLKKEFEPA